MYVRKEAPVPSGAAPGDAQPPVPGDAGPPGAKTGYFFTTLRKSTS